MDRAIKTNADSLVLLVGQTCSGKTTISRKMAENDFEVRSASKALKTVGQLSSHEVDDRPSLSAFGLELRRASELWQFHEELFSNWTGLTPLLIDGARFVETYHYAKQLYPNPRIIYLHCSEDARRQRYELTQDALCWDEVNALETETSVLEFAPLADFTIDTTTADLNALAAQILSHLRIS